MALVLTAVMSLLLAGLVGLALFEVLVWATGRTSPDRLAWCHWLTSGGLFVGASRVRPGRFS